MRKLLAGFILFLVLLIVPAISFVYAALETYANPNFYTDEDIISEIYDTLAEYIAANIGDIIKTENADGSSLMDPQKIASQIEEILPKDAAIDLTQDVIDQLMQEPLPDVITVDLSVIKENMPQVAEAILGDMVSEMEECPEKSMADFDIEGGEMITCIPSDLDREDLLEELAVDPDIFASMPEKTEIDLTVLPEKARNTIQLLVQNNKRLRIGILAIYFLLVTLIGLIIWRPLASVLKWVGNALFWSGLPLAIINLTIDGTMKMLLLKIAQETPEVSVETLEKSLVTAMTFIKLLTDRVEMHGIILTVAGAIMLIIGFVLTRTNDDNS